MQDGINAFATLKKYSAAQRNDLDFVATSVIEQASWWSMRAAALHCWLHHHQAACYQRVLSRHACNNWRPPGPASH
jgi:hypothetical protein